ncbi:MAG: hypothetical protein DWQ01_00450 [Planctomycetota bacterium]|nr:MAG: hypothetical protein DWQ01_00450 [Planctomycetota bacterium]
MFLTFCEEKAGEEKQRAETRVDFNLTQRARQVKGWKVIDYKLLASMDLRKPPSQIEMGVSIAIMN